MLPLAGVAEIGLLPDMYINEFGERTKVTVQRPSLGCPVYDCPLDESAGTAIASSGTGGGRPNGRVDVLAQEVVGPYETVQLKSEDPDALNLWLADHGYQIPQDVQGVIADYVKQGFSFLAMKLVPGQGVDKMQPVSITTQGANPQLPLKMVAAGTGATTLMTLYVVAEGRYEPSNFPSFAVDEKDLVWDWDTESSNYAALRQASYDASNGHAWQVESVVDLSVHQYRNWMSQIIEFNGPDATGYDGLHFDEAMLAADEDMDRLFAGMDPMRVKVTRLRGELSREALGTDLVLGATDIQDNVDRFPTPSKTSGTKPACPPKPSWCDGGGSSANPSGGYLGGGARGFSVSSCGYQPAEERAITGKTGFTGLFLLLGLGFAVRRRRHAA